MQGFHSHKWPEHVPRGIWMEYYGYPWVPKLMESTAFAPLWSTLIEQRKTCRPSAAWREVANAVAHSMDGFPGADPMPKLERKRRATKIRNAVRNLEAELDAISGAAGKINLHVDLLLSWLDGSPLNGATPFNHRIREVLPALASAVDDWANTAPQLSHQDSPRARLLWMARNLRRVFFNIYGRPFDSHVIAICEVYFGPVDYDSATLRRVAPKDKLRNWKI